MFYDFAIFVPASTTQAAPVKERLQLTTGIIHQVEIVFPDGCAGLAHLQILQGGVHLYPYNRNGSFASNNESISFSDHHEITTGRDVLTALAWNNDDTYPHTLTIRVGILTEEILHPPRPEVGLIEYIYNVVRRWFR